MIITYPSGVVPMGGFCPNLPETEFFTVLAVVFPHV